MNPESWKEPGEHSAPPEAPLQYDRPVTPLEPSAAANSSG